MKYAAAFLALCLALCAATTPSFGQELIQTTDGIFYCHGDHPRCSWPDQSTYPYHQFGGQHVGQVFGYSDLLPNGPALIHYQTFLSELISQRPNTNAVAGWFDASSVVDGGRVWGGFMSARSGLPAGADSQLVGLEVDVLNNGLPGVYPNLAKLGIEIVGFGNTNTSAIDIATETPSAAFENVIGIQRNTVASDGAVIGMAPQNAGRGIDFTGSTFSDAAFIVSPNQRFVFRAQGLGDAAIYRDEFSNGYLVLQAGPPGLRITNNQNSANLLIVTPTGDLITPLGSFSNVLSRLNALDGKSATAVTATPLEAVQTRANSSGSAVSTSGVVTAAATGVNSTAVGSGAVASGDHSLAAGSSTTASGTDAVAIGNGAQASGNQSLAVATGSIATATASTAIGEGAQASGTNSVALGANSTDGGQANVVSVGSRSQARRLTNIAAGIEAADAVNLGQLNGAISTAQAYTDARLSAMSYDLANVRQDVKAIRRDAEGATASAMALAGIPQTFERGKGMVGVGVGTWQGESAIAVGLSKATDDGRFVLKAGASYNSRSQGGANAGVGWAF